MYKKQVLLCQCFFKDHLTHTNDGCVKKKKSKSHRRKKKRSAFLHFFQDRNDNVCIHREQVGIFIYKKVVENNSACTTNVIRCMINEFKTRHSPQQLAKDIYHLKTLHDIILTYSNKLFTSHHQRRCGKLNIFASKI